MAQYVVVEAADGYRATFALAELDPTFTDRVILLADRRDGKPLSAQSGPLQIVVPGEKKARPLGQTGDHPQGRAGLNEEKGESARRRPSEYRAGPRGSQTQPALGRRIRSCKTSSSARRRPSF